MSPSTDVHKIWYKRTLDATPLPQILFHTIRASTWRKRERVRWKRQQLYLVCGSEMTYGNKHRENMPLLLR